MSVFRPSNINKRRSGFNPTITTGNGGSVGPNKTPYLCPITMQLGQRCTGGCCGGVFKVSESACGIKGGCKCNISDCKGNVYCITTCNWFIAASCSETSGQDGNVPFTACTCAINVLGSCGWAATDPTTLQNALACYQYWDTVNTKYIGTGNQNHPGSRQFIVTSGGSGGWAHKNQYGNGYGRAFRCVVR